MPNESTVYIGDHRHLPYGEKPRTFIQNRVISLIDVLIRRKSKIIVVACNTATVMGIEVYRSVYPNIPIVGVVPVVKTAVSVTKTGRIAILSTPKTARSVYQKRLIREFASSCRVFSVGAPGLVGLVEEGLTDHKNIASVTSAVLKNLSSKNIDTLVLGCTHFPFLNDTIRAIVGERMYILDSGEAVARHVQRILANNNALTTSTQSRNHFLTTGDATRVSRIASSLVKTTITFTHVAL